MMQSRYLLVTVFLLTILTDTGLSCSSCAVQSLSVLRKQQAQNLYPSIGLAAIERKSILLAGLAILDHAGRVFLTEEESRGSDSETVDERDEDEGIEKDGLSTAMVASIGFYKQFISPLLPPACRFLPTCSQYGVQAIEQFGPTKGAILTAWRLARCSPFGGKGYDPPRWPPVAYNYGSY